MNYVERLPDSQRVVITGVGAVTPLGLDVASSSNRLFDAQSGIVANADSPLSAYPGFDEIESKVVGSVPDFELPAEFRERKIKVDQKSMHRAALLGVRAIHEALSSADLISEALVLDSDKVDPYRSGLYMGSTFSGMNSIVEASGKDQLMPSDLFKSLLARPATSNAMQFDTRNLSPLLGWECASGAVTVDIGARSLLKYRDDMPPVADVVIAGGLDAPVAPANLRYFGALKKAVSPATDPGEASRPFDKSADGLVMAEGAAALVLETWEHARARGLKPKDIKAELVGYASFTDAASRTKAGIEGAVRAMSQAAYMARMVVGETVYINAHATSTGEGDPIEAMIIQEFIRNSHLRRNDVWVNSTKGATGHTMGAAGAIEAIFSIEALRRNTIPPSLNLEDPINETDGLTLAPHEARKLSSVDLVISNSLGFGGGAVALAFRKFQP